VRAWGVLARSCARRRRWRERKTLVGAFCARKRRAATATIFEGTSATTTRTTRTTKRKRRAAGEGRDRPAALVRAAASLRAHRRRRWHRTFSTQRICVRSATSQPHSTQFHRFRRLPSQMPYHRCALFTLFCHNSAIGPPTATLSGRICRDSAAENSTPVHPGLLLRSIHSSAGVRPVLPFHPSPPCSAVCY